MRITLRYTLFFCFSCSAIFIADAQDFPIQKDFRDEWKIYQNDQFQSFDREKGKATTIYFMLDAARFPGTTLRVSSPELFALFINGQLMGKRSTNMNLDVDSLRDIFQSSLVQVSVHQDKIRSAGLQTFILANVAIPLPPAGTELLGFSFFRDFAITGMLILMVMLIVIIQLNPKLASDYFSITRIFSMREGDDSQAYSRITSSINILFYAYCSLMLGYYLIIIFHFLPSHYSIAVAFQPATFWSAILQWLALSLIILMIFAAKIILIYVLSYVFGMSEIGGIHFFNWVRLLLGVFGTLTIVLFLYFIPHGQRENFYVFLLGAMAWILAGWTILIILKLQHQLGHSMFHLFSYICATELIPFLITIKVLYY